jgi:hypothetical protein
MELTTEEKRRFEEEDLQSVSDRQYRAEVRAELQGKFAPLQKSGWSWIFGIGLVLVVAIWFVDHLGR